MQVSSPHSPTIKHQYAVDICIVNGENSADGNGITPASAKLIFDSGADVITGGNHTYRRPEFYELLDSSSTVIRPGTFPVSAPGRGFCVIDRGRYQVTVINIMGVVYMEPLACPFDTLDMLLEQAGNPKFCIVDFHAEATAEKRSDFMRTGAFRHCSAHIPMCKPQTSRLCPTERHILQISDDRPYHVGSGIKPELAMKRCAARFR